MAGIRVGFNYHGRSEANLNLKEPVKAWRGWRLSFNMLMGLGVSYGWPHGAAPPARHLETMMSYMHSDAPAKGCPCGYWGMKTLDDLLNIILRGPYDRAAVIGTINMWGRVFEWTTGWRAQYAYPDTLYVLKAYDAALALRSAYRVDVVEVNRFTDVRGLLRLQQGGGAEAAA